MVMNAEKEAGRGAAYVSVFSRWMKYLERSRENPRVCKQIEREPPLPGSIRSSCVLLLLVVPFLPSRDLSVCSKLAAAATSTLCLRLLPEFILDGASVRVSPFSIYPTYTASLYLSLTEPVSKRVRAS